MRKKTKNTIFTAASTFTLVLGFLFIPVSFQLSMLKAEAYNVQKWNFQYTGQYQTWVAPEDGNYQVELWGAAGSQAHISMAGKGGYTKGTIYLKKGTTLYIYVGSKQGWNGGGQNGHVDTVSGGGATDIRLKSGKYDDIDGLRSRIMVAGGGGGAEWNNYIGGDGGGLTGGNGTFVGGSIESSYLANGGSQTRGGSGYYQGSFGIAKNLIGTQIDGGGMGGGGYFAGGSPLTAGAGGGGSSFISGYSGVNAVDVNGNLTNQPNHYSGYVFHDMLMRSGVNLGDGRAVITLVEDTPRMFTISPSTDSWTNQPVVLKVTAPSPVTKIILPNGAMIEGNSTVYTANKNDTYSFIGLDANEEAVVFTSYVVSNIDRTGKKGTILPADNNWRNQDVHIQINETN